MPIVDTVDFSISQNIANIRSFGGYLFSDNGKHDLFMKGWRAPYTYTSGKKCGKTEIIDFRRPLFNDSEEFKCLDKDRVVSLSPSRCSSFAVWPTPDKFVGIGRSCSNCSMDSKNNCSRSGCLLTSCNEQKLRPQFVLLAVNWSAQIDQARGQVINPMPYHNSLPAWNNYHEIATRKPPKVLEEVISNSIFSGAYMTDFVKGFVDSQSGGVYQYLENNNVDQLLLGRPFHVFINILQNELEQLNKFFNTDDVQKYIVIFGPTLYGKLLNMATQLIGCPFSSLFPQYKILHTGYFYSNFFGTREAHVAKMREIYGYRDNNFEMLTNFRANTIREA